MNNRYLELLHKTEPLIECPVCRDFPFRSFLRGLVFRPARSLFSWPPLRLRPSSAVICSACKEIVSYE